MKIAFATWYMESAWTKLGRLRNVRFLHKLFNVCYSARIQEFKAQIIAMEVRS